MGSTDCVTQATFQMRRFVRFRWAPELSKLHDSSSTACLPLRLALHVLFLCFIISPQHAYVWAGCLGGFMAFFWLNRSRNLHTDLTACEFSNFFLLKNRLLPTLTWRFSKLAVGCGFDPLTWTTACSDLPVVISEEWFLKPSLNSYLAKIVNRKDPFDLVLFLLQHEVWCCQIFSHILESLLGLWSLKARKLYSHKSWNCSSRLSRGSQRVTSPEWKMCTLTRAHTHTLEVLVQWACQWWGRWSHLTFPSHLVKCARAIVQVAATAMTAKR